MFFFYHPQNELITYYLETIHRVTKIPCLKLFLLFQYPYLDKRYRYFQHIGMTQFRLMPVVSHLYVSGRGAALR